jgi:hypothetical protein
MLIQGYTVMPGGASSTLHASMVNWYMQPGSSNQGKTIPTMLRIKGQINAYQLALGGTE